MTFVGVICAVSLLPLALTLLSTVPETQERIGHSLSKRLRRLPVIGAQYSHFSSWYEANVLPVQELRPLAAPPAAWEGRWFDVAKNYASFEKWFGDHLGLRDLMIRSKNELDYQLFRSSSRVYFGKGGDIYSRNLIDTQLPATERLFALPEDIDATVEGVVRYSQDLKARGVTVVFLAPMQKVYFYPDQLPFFAPRLPEPTHFMAFHRQLRSRADREPDFHFIDVVEILTSLEGKVPLFYTQDFHWTTAAALAVARDTTNRIAELEGSPVRWKYPLEFTPAPFVGSEARFSARLNGRDVVLEPELTTTTFVNLQVARPLDAGQTGLEYDTDTLDRPDLLPATCMYGNSFADRLIMAGLLDHYQKFTRLDRSRLLTQVPDLIAGRCKYLIVQVLDVQASLWTDLRQLSDQAAPRTESK